MLSSLLVLATAFALTAESSESLVTTAQVSESLASEESAVQTLRAFDLQQQDLADKELFEADALRMEGKFEEFSAKVQAAEKRFKEVREAYEIALAKYPENARFHNWYGEILHDRFDAESKAFDAWKHANELDPALPAPYNNLGLFYCHSGEYGKGIENLDKALKLEPDNADFHFNMAQVYLVHGPQVGEIRHWEQAQVYEEAMKLSRKAVDLDATDYQLTSDYALNFFTASNFGAEADWKEAARAWGLARPLARNQDEVLFTLLNEARSLLRAGENTAAIVPIEEALRLMPDSNAAKLLLERAKAAPAS